MELVFDLDAAARLCRAGLSRETEKQKSMQHHANTSASQGPGWHATTIISVRKNGRVAIAGDGQVSVGDTVMKSTARKIRPLAGGKVLAGFAGATADAFTLFERLEAKLERHPGQLARAAVELAKDWRTDKYLRQLQAMMIVVDPTTSLVVTGNGDVLEPDGGVVAIGSGGNYALAAGRALYDQDLSADDIARKAMTIAADICVYTNHNIVLEGMDTQEEGKE